MCVCPKQHKWADVLWRRAAFGKGQRACPLGEVMQRGGPASASVRDQLLAMLNRLPLGGRAFFLEPFLQFGAWRPAGARLVDSDGWSFASVLMAQPISWALSSGLLASGKSFFP